MDYLNTKIPVGECAFIQDAGNRGQLTGIGRYIEKVEKIIGRRIEHRRPGRQKKKINKGKNKSAPVYNNRVPALSYAA